MSSVNPIQIFNQPLFLSASKSMPQCWDVVELNTLCDLQNGYAFDSDDYVESSNTLNCRMSNIRPYGGFDLDYNPKYLPDFYAEKYNKFLLKDGDVIIAMTDMASEPKILGVPTIVATAGRNVLLNQRVGKLLIKEPERLYFPYLKYVLTQDQVKQHYLKFASGGVQINLGKTDLLSVKIPLPPIAEQKRIAAILDKAEELRGLRRKALEELDAIVQSIFLEMFGDPEENPKKWAVLPLSHLVKEFRYGTSNKSQSQGNPALRIPNVIGGTLNLDDLKVVPVDDSEFERLKLLDGDLLFVRTNGNPDFVGRCAVFESRLVANTGFQSNEFVFASYLIRARLILKSIEPIFIREFLLGSCGRKELRSRCKTSAGQFNINIPSLSAISVPVPPLILQQEFARRVEAIEQLKATHRESLAQLDALFASLQHRAFRGEL